jgi:hypothetical protein
MDAGEHEESSKGSARVTKWFSGINEDTGDKLFVLRNLTGLLENQPDIHELRKLELFANAGFLKAGPADTIFRISPEQGEYLFEKAGNQSQTTKDEQVDQFDPEISPNDVDYEASEGNRKLVTHLMIERQPNLRIKKLASFKAKHNTLFCETCGDKMEITSRILIRMFLKFIIENH